MNQSETGGYGEVVTLLLATGHVTGKQVQYAERVRSKLTTATPLLNVLKELKYVNDEMVRQVMADASSSLRIGELLVELGHLPEDDLRSAFNIQKEKDKDLKLGEVLIKYNFIEESLFNRILSMQLGYPLIEVNLSVVDKKQLKKVPLKIAIQHGFVPVYTDDKTLLVAFSDPLDQKSIAMARKMLGANISVAIAPKSALKETLGLLAGQQSGKKIDVDSNTVVGIVNSVVLEALRTEASDIHFEPMADRLQIRFREDGVLLHFKDYPRDIIPALASRIKIMCDADIAERRRHQGGRILFNYDEGKVDIRVSVYVTVHGEKIVFRLLKQKKELMDIHSLGMSPKMLNRFLEDAVYQPSGVLLVTGPTGSGKTSSVYSCIQHIKNPQISIITAEEPVEYIMDGISQCSIDPQINLTFDETLRHIVRQDPDVIVIGEIRDRSSAEMAVQSALTGHKVITTFHTEDSIGGLIRLLNMDIAPFLISSTVVSVLAQRLLRRVCTACAVETKITPQQLQRLGCNMTDLLGATFKKGRGCSECKQTGYRGRVGVFELLVLNELVRDAILSQRTSYDIRQISIEHSGLVTLLEDGLVKAANGTTSVDELLRCLPKLSVPRPLAEIRRLSGE
ncbi:MAG: ATPase, T2SS/T4P/T4SS family [Desulfopila sp.]|jgi:type IV pilus assembly protein PilB|nr:ATPase, T2SS/T4P/T4SS family [Desulfopila sp.]